MSRNLQAERMRRLNRGAHLFIGHELLNRIVPRGGDPTGWHEFDERRATALVLADAKARLLRRVDDPILPVRMQKLCIEAVPRIAVPGCRTERLERDPKPGPRDLA